MTSFTSSSVECNVSEVLRQDQNSHKADVERFVLRFDHNTKGLTNPVTDDFFLHSRSNFNLLYERKNTYYRWCRFYRF
jgi:hypothetical protein